MYSIDKRRKQFKRQSPAERTGETWGAREMEHGSTSEWPAGTRPNMDAHRQHHTECENPETTAPVPRDPSHTLVQRSAPVQAEPRPAVAGEGKGMGVVTGGTGLIWGRRSVVKSVLMAARRCAHANLCPRPPGVAGSQSEFPGVWVTSRCRCNC